MGTRNKVTPEQWRIAKDRWESCDKPGFEWLVREMVEAFGGPIIRQTVSVRATREAWEKHSDAQPSLPIPRRPDVAQHGTSVAQHGDDVAQHSKRQRKAKAGEEPPPEVADEVVDAPAPKGKPAARAVGRPSKYEDRFAELIVEWFDKEPYTDEQVDLPNGSVKLQRMATPVPMLAGFAKSIGSDLRTVNRWATELAEEGKFKHPDFAEAYARAREMQEALVASGAMLGVYESRAAAFFLKNKHGWQDQPAQKVSVAAISREELDRIYGSGMEAARRRAIEVAERKLKMLEASNGGR